MLTFSTVDHLETDGQMERVTHLLLEDMICAYVIKKQTNWEHYLPLIKFAYSSAKHFTTSFSPFMLMYGFQPRSPVTVGLASKKRLRILDMLRTACLHVRQIQGRYKKYANKKRRLVHF